MGKKQPVEASEDWITTFGDLMSLMLCFFLMLYTLAMENVSKDELKQIFEEIRSGFNETLEIESRVTVMEEEKLELKEEIESIIIKEQLEDFVQVVIEEKKLRITLEQPVVFNSGSATMNKTGIKALKAISEILQKTTHALYVEGHTDNVPIHTSKFDSNWDLSFARASSIIKFFVHELGFDASRLSGTGFAEFDPVAPNDTKEGRSKNRRIELNVLFRETIFE